MVQELSKELIEEIRERVRNGKLKVEVSREMGIQYWIVRKYTKDIPTRKIFTLEEKEKIREMVREIGVKSFVAQELGIPVISVCKITKDMKFRKGNRTIGTHTFRLLNEILENGYALLTNGSSVRYRTLKKHFPLIQKAHAKNMSIAFLPDKREEAVRYFLQNMKYNVMSFQELKSITRLFGVNLDSGEKRKILGKPKQIDVSTTQTDILDF